MSDVINANKPPLGITPKHIWERNRVTEILNAMFRYSNANKSIPIEWLEELSEEITKLDRLE